MSEAVAETPVDATSEEQFEWATHLLDQNSDEVVAAIAEVEELEDLTVLEETESAGKNRKGVKEALAKQRVNLSPVEAVSDEPAWADSPVPELLPVIGVGHWVRLKSSKSVPKHLVGRDAVVIRAPVHKAEADRLSPVPYEYQDGSEEFLVRCRDTSEELSLSRSSFASFDTDAVRLTAA